MLKLVNITKTYEVGDSDAVMALQGVDIEFRRSEFVSILGQSGCGKTTLLNIVGGLDRYTDGDLIIDGRSTKEYNDHDWDTYRNHSIGFVFQSYNLIPHQTVLSNVELALTLSGVSKSERRKRAIAALEKVGLGDQLNKKPNQMSGGQMQRVAIARALINDPEILLADEPTGALDSETSVQIMELLKEVANDRLVIMVTHNPDLAEEYSTRIIRLLDGKVVGDSNPYDSAAEGASSTKEETAKERKEKLKKHRKAGTSMSFLTALSLSLNNLMTKKGRTFMTAFAGSIGIIGIALILSLSAGFQAYIDKVQEDTLSSYPITINAEEMDMSALFETMTDNQQERENREKDKVYPNTDMYDMMNAMFNSEAKQNDLKALKAWIDSGKSGIQNHASAIQYGYNSPLQVYVDTWQNKDIIPEASKGTILHANDFASLFAGAAEMSGMNNEGSSNGGMMSMMSSTNSIKIFSEMISGQNGETINDLIYEQYELLDDKKMHWPTNKNQVLLVVNEYNEISETFLYSLGLLDRNGLLDIIGRVMSGEKIEENIDITSNWTYDDLVGMTFKLILPTDRFINQNGVYMDMSTNVAHMQNVLREAEEIEVVGIIRPKEDAVATALQNTAVAYTRELTDWYLNEIANSDMVKAQLANPQIDIFKNLPFLTKVLDKPVDKADDFVDWIKGDTVDAASKAKALEYILRAPTEAEIKEKVGQLMPNYPDRAAKEQLIIEYNRNHLLQMMVQSGRPQEEISDEYIREQIKLDEKDDAGLLEAFMTAVSDKAKNEIIAENEKRLTEKTDSEKVDELKAIIAKCNGDVTALAALYDVTVDARYSKTNLKETLKKMGYADKDDPAYVNIYASSFENKDKIAAIISDYNKGKPEEEQITYTDYLGIMMSSISTIIDIISYVLIAFVSISLIVSSIMIGIITYISVLERTKEIGILRSIGASKKDISRVFNAETLIVGFVSGMLGILVTVLLNIPISLIIEHFADISGLASLPFGGGVILVAISMVLTVIAGLIPARVAAKKDPVVALRTE